MRDRRLSLITGAASGIGRALAEAQARTGIEVVLADRQLGRARQVAAAIREAGGAADAVELDVRSADAFERVAAELFDRAGRIDYLFNNAGINIPGEVTTYARADWDDVLDVNLRGVVYGVQAVYPRMVRQGFGHIVNTASVAGLVPTANNCAYSVAKHGVVGLSKTLRIEAKRHGVRVSALCPGMIRTPMLTGGEFGRSNVRGLSPERRAQLFASVRVMDANELAARALRDVERNCALIVYPSWYRVMWALERLSPPLAFHAWERIHQRLLARIAALVDEDARH